MPAHTHEDRGTDPSIPRVALVTGINGQDGSYLSELLLAEHYEVHGVVRRSSVPNLERLDGVKDQLHLHYADMTDGAGLARIVAEVMPTEVYNLAALSDVRVSFDTAVYSGDVTGLGCARMLEVCHAIVPDVRYYQAGSSEMFGMWPHVPTNEDSPFLPASPYAAAKVYAHHLTQNYRDAHGMFAVNGVLFNHESERRGESFVSRKISLGVAAIAHGRAEKLTLGRLDTRRDWGHARDYVRAMWMMLQAPAPSDYVIATGHSYTVEQFAKLAFDQVGLNWQHYVKTDEQYFRPVDPPHLLGDATKARDLLGWEPETSFAELVRLMVESDLKV